MQNGQLVTIIISTTTVLFGIIGFFLKRTIVKVDDNEKNKASKKEVCELDKEKASKAEVEAIVVRLARAENAVAIIKSDYLTKEDFYREQAKTDRQLERIIDILLKMEKGISKHEQN